MNEKACIKCKHFNPIFTRCNKGMMRDNEIWGEKYELKYEGKIEDVRYYKCMGKDFEPIEIKTLPPKKTRFRRFLDKLLLFKILSLLKKQGDINNEHADKTI